MIIYLIASTSCFWAILAVMLGITRDIGFPEGGWPGLILIIVLAATGTVLSVQSVLHLVQ